LAGYPAWKCRTAKYSVQKEGNLVKSAYRGRGMQERHPGLSGHSLLISRGSAMNSQ
jgi:hypothetical protein